MLGGGIVPGSLVLVGGEPGIGKSTLLLQVLDAVSRERPVMLVCGEESAAQVKMRAERICASPDDVLVLAETELEPVAAAVQNARPAVVVVDSIQTLYDAELTSAPGSVSQVRECSGRLPAARQGSSAPPSSSSATSPRTASIAGPRVLEHMVDTVLQFEGDRNRFFRTLRAAKNRFGSTNELGVFEMDGDGLHAVDRPVGPVPRGAGPAAGSCVHVAVEGTRCFLVEAQALVNPTDLAMPRRVATGFDRNRLAMIVAVLSRHAGLTLSTADIFVNIAAGFASKNPQPTWPSPSPSPRQTVESRWLPGSPSSARSGSQASFEPAGQAARRVAEAAKVGFGTVYMPRGDADRAGGLSAASPVGSLAEAVTRALPRR